MLAKYYSFPSVEKMWEAELKIGENELSYALYGVCLSMIAANMTNSNEEEEVVYKKITQEAQGPGFFVIIAGQSAKDFAFKKKALEKIVSDADGQSLKTADDPEIQGILMCQCIRTQRLDQRNLPGGRRLQIDPHHGPARC